MNEEKRCCINCENSRTEEWPKNKTALRCFAEGEWKGRTTVIFPAGHPARASGSPAPVWCNSYRRKQ